MCCLSTQRGQITAWLIKSTIGLWSQILWLGNYPSSSGSVHAAFLSREPGWLRSCLPSDERHVGFWMQSDARPALEHLFAKTCFSVISSILRVFFCFLLEKVQSIQKLYIALLVFPVKGRLPLIQWHRTWRSCLVFSTGAVQSSRVLSVFGFRCSLSIRSLLIVNGCIMLYQLDTS